MKTGIHPAAGGTAFAGVTTFMAFYEDIKFDDLVKSPLFVIARSSANAGRRSNPVFSRTYKNEIASLSLAMTLLPTFYEDIKFKLIKKIHAVEEDG
ncbi:MAG: hypothetical protein ABH969_01085 [Pseudomonadota bacterium]